MVKSFKCVVYLETFMFLARIKKMPSWGRLDKKCIVLKMKFNENVTASTLQ